VSHEVHEPTPDGPIARIEITWRDGQPIDPSWGRRIAEAAASAVNPGHIEVHIKGGLLTEGQLRDAIHRSGPGPYRR
jgi:hypothetical protein